MNLAEKTIVRLKKKITFQYNHKRIENALCLMTSMAELQYLYNQQYKDDFLESIIKEIADLNKEGIKHHLDNEAVLFYDGFGLDNRGLVQIYLKALSSIGYKIIYVTQAKKKESQPQVMLIVNKDGNHIYNYSGQSMIEKIQWLDHIAEKHAFSNAFFYTTPWDVPGTIAFEHLEKKCTRYQINLTDHAFWLGVNAFDFSLEFRNYGAAISRDYRGLSEKKLLYLPYYPIVRNDIEFQGFSFNTKGKKIIFSGGAIYKTIDKSNTFYFLIEQIILQHEDVVFVYASDKSSNQLDMLVNKYPNQIFWIKERKDLIQVLKHSYLYLNTYPISGALMLQYAAIAGCIPVTLRRLWDDDASGILRYEEELGETFYSIDTVLNEINKLLSDDNYYKSKKSKLVGQVITELEFNELLNSILNNPSFNLIEKIYEVDTSMFIQTYRENISEREIVGAVINSKVKRNIFNFPDFALKRLIMKLKRE